MEFPDWTDMELYHYLIFGGGIVVVVAVLGYFLKTPRVKVPAIIVGVVASLALGIGLGVVLMASAGYQLKEEPKAQARTGAGGRMGPGGGMGGGGRGMMGGGMMGGMGGGPSARSQLATLVGKLDQLTSKSLVLSLTDDQKKVIADQTSDLLEKKELDDKDAKKRLDAILKVLEKDKATFEAAGYRWPGQRGGGFQRPRDVPNPFKEGPNAKHLKAVRDQVGPEKPRV